MVGRIYENPIHWKIQARNGFRPDLILSATLPNRREVRGLMKKGRPFKLRVSGDRFKVSSSVRILCNVVLYKTAPDLLLSSQQEGCWEVCRELTRI